MSKYVLAFIFCFTLLSCSFSQETRSKKIEPDFKGFLDVFPLREVPFNLFFDSNMASEFDVPLPEIPIEYVSQYIQIDELSQSLAICSKEFILGYMAFSRFDIAGEFVTIIITISADPGCGQRDLMVTYNLQGEYIDHLIVFGSGLIKRPTPEDRGRIAQRFESTISNDYVKITERITSFSSKNEISSVDKTIRGYKIEPDGTFSLISEEQAKNNK